MSFTKKHSIIIHGRAYVRRTYRARIYPEAVLAVIHAACKLITIMQNWNKTGKGHFCLSLSTHT